MFPRRRDLDGYPDGLPLRIHVRIGRLRQSVTLGVGTLHALYDILDREGVRVNDICLRVAEDMRPEENFTEALRSYVVNYFKDAATEDGHQQAGHGNVAVS